MSISEIKAKAHALVQGRRGKLLVSNMLTSMASGIPLVGVFAAGPANLGMAQMNKDVTDGKEPEYSVLWSKFKQIGSSFFLTFLLSVLILVSLLIVVIVGALFTLIPIIGIIVLIALIIAYAIAITMYVAMPYYVLLVEPELDGDAAYKKGIKMAKGHWKDFGGYIVAYLGQILLGIITCGIYMVYITPEVNLAFFMLQRQIYESEIDRVNAELATPAPAPTASAPETPAAPAPTAPAPAPEAPADKYCSKCGAKNPEDSAFCEQCGNKLD